MLFSPLISLYLYIHCNNMYRYVTYKSNKLSKSHDSSNIFYGRGNVTESYFRRAVSKI